MKDMELQGRTALVTGASSGIGRALAHKLAWRGCDLALCDIDGVELAETAKGCEQAGVRVTQHVLDVADAHAIAALPERIMAEHGRLDILVNNAGVALGGTFEQVSEADFHWLFDINFWGVVRMTRAFLPMLRASDDARLVNISSLFGIIAPAGQTAYCASKFAVRGFTEALAEELDGSSVGVSTVHPGGVATSIAKNARRPQGVNSDDADADVERVNRMLTLPPERAAATIVSGIEKRKRRILVGRDAKIVALAERVAPLSWRKLVPTGD